MKNLMQKLVKATLCLGVVSASLIACEPNQIESNTIDLDKIENQLIELDSLVEDTIVLVDISQGESVELSVIKEKE
jgi:hypothetical protein